MSTHNASTTELASTDIYLDHAATTPMDPAWSSRPVVDKPVDWRWMQAVFVRVDEVSGHARISPTVNPKDWTRLPLAILDPEDIDLFESEVTQPQSGTILAYPLRIVSLPREPIRVGDRRMIRRRPENNRQFELCALCRIPTDEEESVEVELDIGGGYRIHSIAISQEQLRLLLQHDVLGEMPAMLRFVLKNVELDAESDITLSSDFDSYLRTIEDPLSWLLAHVEPNSGDVPRRRIAALEHDDKRIADWLHQVARATNQNRPRDLDGDDKSQCNHRDDDYDRIAE